MSINVCSADFKSLGLCKMLCFQQKALSKTKISRRYLFGKDLLHHRTYQTIFIRRSLGENLLQLVLCGVNIKSPGLNRNFDEYFYTHRKTSEKYFAEILK